MNALRRIGALGDVHCEDALLARALEALRDLGVDEILCVGDIVDGLGDVNRTCDLLRSGEVLCVAGNHDRWLLAGERRGDGGATDPRAVTGPNRRWLQTLPATRRLPTVAGPLLLCHGVGDDDMATLRSDTCGYALQELDNLRALMLDPSVDFLLGGHTHERMVRRFQGLTVVNPGTLHRDHGAGFALVDFEARQVRFFDLDDGAVREAETAPLPLPAPLP